MQGTMAVAHAHGVVHADLKPENILLLDAVGEGSIECPQVVITDFGSAFSTSETDIARVAFEMQTLPYRAPEVLIFCALPACTMIHACNQALHMCHHVCHQRFPRLVLQLEECTGEVLVKYSLSAFSLLEPDMCTAELLWVDLAGGGGWRVDRWPSGGCLVAGLHFGRAGPETAPVSCQLRLTAAGPGVHLSQPCASSMRDMFSTCFFRCRLFAVRSRTSLVAFHRGKPS